jgi:formate hydrogenlyase subunit 6/NADH:ubiquinone oxidoreductase subunit I
MIPFIVKERCAAQPEICPPMKACPKNAFLYVEDEDEPIGGRIEINLKKCDSCGKCAEICCGHCIEMR